MLWRPTQHRAPLFCARRVAGVERLRQPGGVEQRVVRHLERLGPRLHRARLHRQVELLREVTHVLRDDLLRTASST